MSRRAALIYSSIFLAMIAAATQPDLQSQLAAIDAKAAGIKDLTAHFEQRKYTAMLNEPLISSGIVRSAGNVIRWDTQQPEASVLYADGGSLKLYYPAEKLEEVYPIQKRMADLLTSPVPRLAAIREHFTISLASSDDVAALTPPGEKDELLGLQLAPSEPELAKHVRQVIVLLNMKTGLGVAARTTDADGDHTDIAFSDVHLNTGLDAGQLELKLPAGVSVSHPMEGVPSGNSP